MKFFYMSFVFAGLALTACNSAKKDPDSPKNTDSVKAAVADNLKVNTPVANDQPAGLLQETVTLKKIDEGAYPLAALHTETPNGREIILDFNQEDQAYKGPKLQELSAYIGKEIRITYTSANQNNAMHIMLNNKDVEDGKTVAPGYQDSKVSGILVAPAATAGDLPDTFHIRKADGTSMAFPFFITPNMVKANGKNVDVYYSSGESNTLKEIRLEK